MASTDKLSFIVTAGKNNTEELLGSKATAEGTDTKASGPFSHAEGYLTTASGRAAHAEGSNTTASGEYFPHAEGSGTTASGDYSHAEGCNTKASGTCSHAEGGNYSSAGSVLGDVTIDSSDIPNLSEAITVKGPVAYSTQSHAEGAQTLAYGYSSHAEGYRTIASGDYSHAEGYRTIASGDYSHAEGCITTASGDRSHAEGYKTTASGSYSHAEGDNTTASGIYSHAEGFHTEASGSYSHAEGDNTTASGTRSHAEGDNTTASGDRSHAEGGNYSSTGYNLGSITIDSSDIPDLGAETITVHGPVADGIQSHAEGTQTLAYGYSSHAEGWRTIASGDYSHAEGYYTTASNYQHAGGKYNVDTAGPSSTSSTTGSIFVLGKGTSSARSNAFRIATTGAVYGNGAYNTSGADYAEYFEWKDKNTDNQDRVGLFVTLDGENIRIANSNDDYILGVVSATPSIVGDSYFGDNWHGMYETDIFGRYIIDTVHVEEHIDEETGETIPDHYEERLVLNPEWNHEQKYEAREDRSEWSAIGMLGKLIVIDDGTCEVNGYCKVADNGIATKSDDKSGYRVMARLDDTHIKILFR